MPYRINQKLFSVAPKSEAQWFMKEVSYELLLEYEMIVVVLLINIFLQSCQKDYL